MYFIVRLLADMGAVRGSAGLLGKLMSRLGGQHALCNSLHAVYDVLQVLTLPKADTHSAIPTQVPCRGANA